MNGKWEGIYRVNKYDEPLDLSSENSLSLIIEQIAPNSTILEFGPAMGRMTKYLTNNLKCDVYIVEIDKDAFNYVLPFAEDGVLGDIEEYGWIDKFNDIKFDYIIFADVLEHLLHPVRVVETAARLLKENGRMMVSVPNIAYNAVIIDLINNKFEYKNTGLLDSTHLRFFTYDTLNPFFEKAGMIVEKEKVVHLNIEHSGFGNGYELIPKEQAQFLKNREFADAYQYVFTVIKRDYYLRHKDNLILEKAKVNGYSTKIATVYYDTGKGFNEQEKLQKKYRIEEDNKFKIKFDFNSEVYIKSIRIDLEYDPCFVENVNLNCNIETNMNLLGYTTGNKTYFVDGKASILIQNTNSKSILFFILTGILDTLSYDDIKLIFNQLSLQLKETNFKLTSLQMDNNAKSEELNNQQLIIVEKDNYINGISSELCAKQLLVEHLNTVISNQKNELEISQCEILNVTNSISWKITKPLRSLGKMFTGGNK